MKLLGKLLLIAVLLVCNVAFSATIVDKNITTFTNKVFILLTPTDPTQAVNKVYAENGINSTNVPWAWFMSDPAPVSTSVNSSNVWVIGQFPYNMAITNKADGATSGTGVYDIVEYTSTNSLDFAGILVYTGLVSTVSGNNSAITVNLTAGKLYGLKLTNAVGLNGWHVQFLGNTK